MESTHDKGIFAQLAVELKATSKGWVVSRPYKECRYDLILDDIDALHRVQVKYCNHDNTEGSILIDLRSECRNNGYEKVYSAKEIDAVIVYLPKLNQLLWLRPEMFEGRKSLTVRHSPPKNNQKTGVTLVQDLVWE